MAELKRRDQLSPMVPRSASTTRWQRAYGPSFEQMHRGGPPSQLEEETGSASGNLAGLPITFNVIY
jgi:hypothetical protein